MTDADEAYVRLSRSGWALGLAAFAADGGKHAWTVVGSNGENLLRAQGETSDDAWLAAVVEARGLGMLRGVRAGAPLPG